jgi:predicted TIM-barrel fold metal-dependent hydrolase
MKKIDFHVHAFADKIAEKAISGLVQSADTKNLTDGTFSDTIKKLNERGINNAVFLPIATKPTQQTVVNNWGKEVIDNGYFAFGSIHPDAADVLEELERIKELGLFGIKLHPEYQSFFVNERRMFPIYQKCSDLGLVITFHTGYDPISRKYLRSHPQMVAEISDLFPELKIVAAHAGGVKETADTLECLAGKEGNIYFDIAILPYYLGILTVEKLIKTHGADRVLFASDCPWADPLHMVNFVEMLDLSETEKENIYYKNALRLLKSVRDFELSDFKNLD